MAEPIATIKLNSGQGGFYDELTRIHLTVSKPVAKLYAGQNLTNIRKGIAVGHLQLVDGTLGPDPRPYRLVRVGNHIEIDVNPNVKGKIKTKPVEIKLKEEPKAEAKEEAKPVPAKEEKKAEEAIAEPVKEKVVEEKTEAKEPQKKTPAKRSTKKSTKKADAE